MITIKPIEMVSAPNFWAPSGKDYWTVTANVPVTLHGVLEITDSLGTRPYTPVAGATLSALFQRGDQIGHVTPNQSPQSITKAAALDANSRSLVSIALTAQDATTIVGGTIVFTLTETGVSKRWTQNWAIKKLNTTPGF